METNIKTYPKVLVLGNTFDEFSGAGVTLTNLFKDWPKERIAVAALKVDVSYCEKDRPCHSYFQLGHGIVQPQSKTVTYQRKKTGKKNALRSCVSYLATKTGKIDWAPSYKLDDKFLGFYDGFAPEIVYSALGGIAIMNFYIKLMSLRNFKPVIHIWDDFLERYNNRWFPSLWKRKSNNIFKKVLERKDMLCLAIGDMMAEEYKRRYGRKFYPFHNPVDPAIWDAVPNTLPTLPTISYFGKINDNTIEGIMDMCRAVEILNEKGIRIEFKIHSGMANIPQMSKIASYANTQIADLLPREEIPSAFKSSTMLFFPISFDKESVRYQKLSIQTKITEYIISKVPIFLYCSPEIAAYKYLDGHKTVITCKQGIEAIVKTMEEVLKNDMLMKETAERAYGLAMERHTVSFVRENFRNALQNIISE